MGAIAAVSEAAAGKLAVGAPAAAVVVVIADSAAGFGSSWARRSRSPGTDPEWMVFSVGIVVAFAAAWAGAAVTPVESGAAAGAEPEPAPRLWAAGSLGYSEAAAPVREVAPERPPQAGFASVCSRSLPAGSAGVFQVWIFPAARRPGRGMEPSRSRPQVLAFFDAAPWFPGHLAFQESQLEAFPGGRVASWGSRLREPWSWGARRQWKSA